MSLSKKIRFDVFKRDGFTCQYCGGHPPAIILEVDHIQPKSKGGKDTILNLITSCFECNRGKRDHELSNVPESLSVHFDLIQEKENQYKGYRKLLDKIENRINKEIDEVQEIFTQAFPDRGFSSTFRSASVKNFISKLDIIQVRDAMSTAICKGKDSHNTIKYFCGICWNQIKDNG